MNPRKTVVLIGFVIAALTVLAGMEMSAAPGNNDLHQPIRFDHARHMKEDMKCTDCHQEAARSPYATFPSIKACLMCHKEAKGTDPEEPKVREFAKAGHEIPWIQVNRLPGHVYFSHGMHVAMGKMDCAECHGDMKQVNQPVETPQISHLTMAKCQACHETRHVANECLTCHK